jgi:uncharacterized protein YdeI (BOF family)
MNNAKAIALVALMSVSSFAMAAYTGPKEQNKVSVAQLKDVADDQWVTLEGKLVKHLGGETTCSVTTAARWKWRWTVTCGAVPRWALTI